MKGKQNAREGETEKESLMEWKKASGRNKINGKQMIDNGNDDEEDNDIVDVVVNQYECCYNKWQWQRYIKIAYVSSLSNVFVFIRLRVCVCRFERATLYFRTATRSIATERESSVEEFRKVAIWIDSNQTIQA